MTHLSDHTPRPSSATKAATRPVWLAAVALQLCFRSSVHHIRAHGMLPNRFGRDWLLPCLAACRALKCRQCPAGFTTLQYPHDGATLVVV